MAAHLRDLPRCGYCNHPATQQMFNAANAPSGTFCDRHAKMALADFIKRTPGQG